MGYIIHKDKISFGRQHIQVITVLVCTAIIVLYAAVRNVETFYWDCNFYWNSADGMLQNGIFDLYSFPNTFRGYFFPTVLLLLKMAGRMLFSSDFFLFRFFMALLISITIGTVIPYLFQMKTDTYQFLLGAVVCVGIILYFWGDFIQYPLSDLPAAAFMCSGTALLKKSLTAPRVVKHILKSCCFGFLAGACFYAAYNTRAAYLYGALFLIAYLAITYRAHKSCLLFVLFSLLAGCILIALPQMLINDYHTGQLTPRVLTEQYTNSQANLQQTQVYWGLSMSRYESYVGDNIVYPQGGVRFDDFVGYQILAREGVTAENFTYGTLLHLFLKYPLDMCGIYTRHFVTLLTPIFSDSYIHELFQPKLVRITVNIILWLCAGTYAVYAAPPIKIRKILLIAGLILPSLLQFFGAPEIRFFLLIHLLFYCYICFGVCWKELWVFVNKHPIRVAIPALIIFFAWTTVISNTLQSCRNASLLINDTPKTYSVQSIVYSAASLDIPNTGGLQRTETIDMGDVHFEDNTLYQLSFDLTCRNALPHQLYFDLYGTDYDSAAQDFVVSLEKGSRRYTYICNSGTVPADAILRMVSNTEEPYIITNLQLAAVLPDW